MSYKTLLVHIDDSRRCDTRVALALDLAQRWDAHLIGLYVVCEGLAKPLFGTDDGFVAQRAALTTDRRETARHAFLAAAERAGRAAQWRAPEGSPVAVTTLHARHADLLVLGQPDPRDPASYVDRHFVGEVVLGAGRPALVIPRAGAVPTLGENVLIAWDGNREASRAIADAMPLLERARFVGVAVVEPTHDHEAGPSAIDVAAWLEAHGVRASFSTTPRLGIAGTGATLLNRVSDLHADLLVMGAYGHSHARERVWGGVTRTMLESMTVPVLMAH
ncbi:nucleotide-binding universal stress UspA family protein [Paraburkholderia sp. HC6.4b]|uniref:universal stress protein n=1 Tax=unclassified Paraburkholderia TaxID=2615204 RepID=UPI00162047B4|nr:MULTISPECIES: universal stress protein [unclassified Paraburkholderia]MBB5407547.1 nucleotide-binding universal stress UspA family protein [Paraburkholderia sp. HC6.4b]MBB5453696.1 nucleotide-binding universal stress UspA family protein [Paraburkholderia sp. Kb1A]